MTKYPQVLTIIVTYNGEKYIRKCLGCLLEAESREYNQVLVIDNNSTDSTCEVIEREFPEVELIRSEKNLGFGKANNIGLREGLKRKIPYVFLLNQDAYVSPDTIKHLLDVAMEYPEYGILSPIQLNGDGTDVDSTFYPYCLCSCRELVFDLAVCRDAIKPVYPLYFTNAAAWLMPSAFLEKVGGFAPIYPHYGEDNDLINRCHYHKCKVGICPGTHIRHDRPQQETSVKDKSVSKLTQDAYIRSLIIFTNVLSDLPNAFKLALLRSIRNQIVDYHPKKHLAELRAWFRVIRSASAVQKTRKQSRESFGAYLK